MNERFGKKEIEKQLAVAVYLSAYFDVNKSSKRYFMANKEDVGFK